MIILIAAYVSFGAAGVFDSTFTRGNDAFAAGDYPGAIAAYEQLVSEGVVHEALFYNLGNAYFEANNLGAAIGNYERALRLAPSYASAKNNLEFAVSKTKNQRARPLPPAWEQSLLMWHYGWSPRAVYMLAVLCWCAFWTLMAARIWRPCKSLTRAAIGTFHSRSVCTAAGTHRLPIEVL